MATEVIKWTKRANRQFLNIIFYYEENYSDDASYKLVTAVYEIIDRLMAYPLIGRPTPGMKTVRQINVNKLLRLYYRIHGKVLIITALFNTRRDPADSPYPT